MIITKAPTKNRKRRIAGYTPVKIEAFCRKDTVSVDDTIPPAHEKPSIIRKDRLESPVRCLLNQELKGRPLRRRATKMGMVMITGK